jgi:RHS repeat-associated protein
MHRLVLLALVLFALCGPSLCARTSTYGYDGDRRPISINNPGANSGPRVASSVYDVTAGGLPRTVFTDSDGRTETSEFDRLGRLRFLRDKRGNAFEFRYDGLGRRTQVLAPGRPATTTTYTRNGRVETVTEPSGDRATYGYHATTGRLSSVTYTGIGGGTVNYTDYDNNGNLLSLNENGAGALTRTYDRRDRVSSYTCAQGAIGYRYYPNGKLAKLIYPGGNETTGHVEYTYDASGRLYQVIDKLGGAVRTSTYAWRSDGRLESVSRPNGTTRTIGYEAAGRPESIVERAGGLAFLSYAIGYYPSDEIRSLTVTPPVAPHLLAPGPQAAMTFGPANRLESANGASTAHDADGNLTLGPPAVGSGFIGYSYNGRNWLTGAGGLTYTYNAEGNRVGITGGGETTSLLVDPTGGLPKVLVRVKNGVTTRYVYGAGLLYELNSANVATYYHYDQSGNTAALTNAAGSLVERVEYAPYGAIRYRQSGFDTPFLYGGFFGVMTDANGLIHMRARYYNPQIGRFLNSDPAMDGWNWYAYANGNPINFADPSGYGASRVLDSLQTGLSFLGFVPALGAIPDVINAGISFARGNTADGLVNLASAVPFVGDAFAAGKVAVGTAAVIASSRTVGRALSHATDAPRALPTIGGRAPVNSGLAGQTHPSGIQFNQQGFPIFGPVSKAEVQLQGLTGSYAKDAALANQAVGLTKTPSGFVWHHVEDGVTMQLVPQSIHRATGHTGGSAVIRNGGFD